MKLKNRLQQSSPTVFTDEPDSEESTSTAMPIDSSRLGVSGRTGSLLVGLAVSSILVPIHPSVQGALHEIGVPTTLLFLIFFVPCALWVACQRSFQRRQLFIVLLFAVYGIWLVLTSVYSPAVGLENWIASVRSLTLILPCVIVAALVAAKKPDTAANIVIVSGTVAFVHYVMLFVLGRAGGGGGSGFRAIATIDGVQNYQSTSYYVGICGITLLAAFKTRKIGFWFLFFGCAVVFVTQGTIGARASIVGLAFVFGLVLVITSLRRLIFFIPILVVIVVIVISISQGWLVSDSIPEGVTITLSALKRFSVLIGEDDSSQRIRLFSSAIELWLRSPFTIIFGGGLGSFPFYTGQIDEKGWYPHNFVLESLAEGGVVAILPLFILACRSLGRDKYADGKNDFPLVFLFYFALYSFVAHMFMGGVESVWIPFFPWLLFLLSKVKHVE